MIIHNATNASRSRICQPYARSATERNLRAKASSRNARTTFTELSQPPERGNDCSIEGKMANTAKGMARAKANPNIPIAGPMATPIEAACTSNVPTVEFGCPRRRKCQFESSEERDGKYHQKSEEQNIEYGIGC